MEKAKVTQEQAEAIDWVMKFSDKSSTVEEHIEYKLEESGWKMDDLKPLNELSTDYLIRALYIGYEVEPEFEVGDWIINKPTGRVAEIDSRYDGGNELWVQDEEFNFFHINDSRHATPSEIAEEKERIWWERHGRELQKVKDGDIVKKKKDGFSFDVAALGEDYVNTNLNLYEIVCFKEKRLDVKTK